MNNGVEYAGGGGGDAECWGMQNISISSDE